MKNLLLSLCLFASFIIQAQVPQAIKYQAVVRDTLGAVLTNSNVTIRVSIIDSAAGGSVVYSEVHNTVTNQFGLLNLSIGRGNSIIGSLTNINWSTENKLLQLELSQNGGVTYQLMGLSEMLSVPYALYAETSTNGPQGVGIDTTIDNGNGTFSLYYSDGSIFTTSNLTGPRGPQGQSDSTFFNPLYPDGTLGMDGVTWKVTSSTPYVVPTGKNLHILRIRFGSPFSGLEVTINQINLGATIPSFLILGSGDSIKRYLGSTDFVFSGYLTDAFVTPVNINLNNGAYVVPNGKQLYVTEADNYGESYEDIFINGFGGIVQSGFSPLPIILNSGDSISVTPGLNFDTYLNGYLK